MARSLGALTVPMKTSPVHNCATPLSAWIQREVPPVSLLLRGGLVVDGTGVPARRADVLLEGGRVQSVGADLPATGAGQVLDVGGLVVAPGFIDLHSHSDFTFTEFPDSPGQVTQGVTSELIGHCGSSPAPVSLDPVRRQALEDYDRGVGPTLRYRWQTVAEYLAALDEARPAVNCLPLVGHIPLRIAAMGMSEREPTPAEIAQMQAGVREALAAGAWGMSTGLSYAPGQWATRAEVLEVARPLAEGPTPALYASHIRNESDELLPAVEEALSIGRDLGVPVEVSHLKAAGVRNFGRTRDALSLIAEARAAGRRAGCDMYPYEAGSTYLSQLFPPWVFDGGIEAMLERIRSHDVRRRIRHDVETGLPAWGNLLRAAGGWDRVLVNGVVTRDAGWAKDRFVADLATERAVDPLDLACELLLADRGATTMAIFMMSIDDVRDVIASPLAGVGSDLYAVTGPGVANHPRCFGSFARVLGPWVRDGLLTLEEAVRKMTSGAASIVGLADRGRVEPGLVADLVIFDPSTVADRATWSEPAREAAGVEHVLLGGEFAVRGGRVEHLRLGRVVRRPPLN
jgi:N-acyl-D-aspartate/D-glutamate deacylase